MIVEPRSFLRSLFDAALGAADPGRVIPPRLPEMPPGRTFVAGAGKAAAAMARAVERSWRGPLAGLVVTRYGHGLPCERVEVVEAGHPLPDGAGLGAAERMLEEARSLGPEDLLLGLWSGGGSALLTLPPAGIGLDDLRAVTGALLRSGASIREINVVRRHLSRIAGGRLAVAASPARVAGLAISDVAGDDPSTIASGPTVPDRSTRHDALEVLLRRGIPIPRSVEAVLRSASGDGAAGDRPALPSASFTICASAADALEAAARTARRAGVRARIVGVDIEGEAAEVGDAHARLAAAARDEAPVVLLSGGETTVTVRGSGSGGPNREYALAAAIALDDAPGIHVLACDTDGIDGDGEAAGAVVAPDSIARGRALGLDPVLHLWNNDSGAWFEAVGDAVVTGPTRTNVNDFRAVLVLPA